MIEATDFEACSHATGGEQVAAMRMPLDTPHAASDMLLCQRMSDISHVKHSQPIVVATDRQQCLTMRMVLNAGDTHLTESFGEAGDIGQRSLTQIPAFEHAVITARVDDVAVERVECDNPSFVLVSLPPRVHNYLIGVAETTQRQFAGALADDYRWLLLLSARRF
jgi:hypothetical protein